MSSKRRRVDLGPLGVQWVDEEVLWAGFAAAGCVAGAVVGGASTFAVMRGRMRAQLRKAKVVREQAEKARERAELDVVEAKRFGTAKFAKALLPVADDLERALQSADENSQEGITMISNNLAKIFQENDVRKLETQKGERFDPSVHEAMMQQSSSELEPNRIIDVFVHGYTLGDRVLRTAKVAVSAPPLP